MQFYETILSHKLCDYDFDPSQDAPEDNRIEQSAGDGRRDQMRRLIQAGQDKTERESKIKDGMKDSMGIVLSIKTIINSTIRAVPQAALPWAIVCMSLEILQNPLNESAANASGVRYVTKRMERYWDIATDVLKGADLTKEDELPSTKRFMKSRLVELYRELLLFQIKSVCSHYRNQGLTLLRDIVKFDDWTGHLENIRNLEAEFQRDYGDYMSQQQTDAGLKMIGFLEMLATFQTEQREIHMEEQGQQCLRDLRITNPRHDRKRIVDSKGGLLWDSYRWILENPQFQQWRDDEQSRLLWIKGDPGKGKTMLLCGILKELEDSAPFTIPLSYFFCQGTDQSFNNANAVLRGLVYMLVSQQPSLISHLQKEYKNAGNNSLFEGMNAWVTLSGIFENILHDSALKNCYVVIDALDECASDRKKLLDLIVRNVSNLPHIKWIVSSRNLDDIENKLRLCPSSIKLGLEVNANTVSEAVGSYIRYTVPRLGLLTNNQKLQEEMRAQLLEKANGTFLWAALVFKELQELEDAIIGDDSEVLSILMDVPSGLTELYHRMMGQINQFADAPFNNRKYCLTILSTMALAYRPIHLVELPTLVGLKNKIAQPDNLRRLIQKCGSFLTIRDNTIYFIHQSAKDYLVGEGHDHLFPSGYGVVHGDIFSRSLDAMSAREKLRHNMYDLSHPGVEIHEVTTPDPDPLADVRYSCIYWLRHLCESITRSPQPAQANNLDDVEKVHAFFKSHFLNWLEALSLMKHMQNGIVSLQSLITLLKKQPQESQGFKFFEDANRFILYSRLTIENAPLQTYVSALIFSPMKSAVRLHFKEELSWIKTLPVVDEHWSPRLQIIRGHSRHVNSMALSSDSKLLASASEDGTIKIWDVATGGELYMLKVHGPTEVSIASSDDSTLLAFVSENISLRLWDATTGKEVWSSQGRFGVSTKLYFSSDSKLLAAINLGVVTIFDTATGKELQKLRDKYEVYAKHAHLSDDFRLLARFFSNGTIKILDTVIGGVRLAIEHSVESYRCMAFSKESRFFAFNLDDNTIAVWDIVTCEELQTFRYSKFGYLRGMTFTGDSKFITCHSELTSTIISIWNVTTGELGQTSAIPDLSFSKLLLRNSELLVSSFQSTIQIWNVAMIVESKAFKHCETAPLVLSNDAKLMASSFSSRTTIWNTDTEKEVHTLVHQDNFCDWIGDRAMAFSSDSRLLAIVSRARWGPDFTISLWSTETGKEVHTWLQKRQTTIDNTGCFASLTFSCDSTLLAITYYSCRTIQIWNTNTGQRMYVLQREQGHNDWPVRLALSHDSKFLATVVPYYGTVQIWNLESQKVIQNITRERELDDILFSNSTLCMATELGYVGLGRLDDVEGDAEPSNLIQLQPIKTEVLNERYITSARSGYSYIFWNAKKLIWLPSEYRQDPLIGDTAFASSSSTIKITTKLRGILTLKFRRPRPVEAENWTPWQTAKLFGGRTTDSGSF